MGLRHVKIHFQQPQNAYLAPRQKLPEHVRYGVNFGLTLSIWDYIFKTSHVPESGRDIELGFEGDEHFPQDFLGQELYPLIKKK